MLPSTVNLIITIAIIVLCMTFARSLIIMIGGKNIFKKANKDVKSVYYPILNLFTLLEIVEMSTFWGILFFFPGTNLIVLTMISIKLGKVFNASKGYRIGLVFFPLMFYPLLAYSDRQYKLSDDEYFKMLDNARPDNMSLLMTDEEISKQNDFTEEEKEEIDSIFKSELELREKVEPYKAENIKPIGYEKIKNTDFENILEPIEIAEPLEPIVSEEQNQEVKKFTSELDKPEEVEVVDF